MTERDDLIESLDRHRGFLLYTVDGLSEEQIRTRSTVSELTLAGLLKHVADTERGWMDFAVRGAEALGGSEVYSGDVDWDAMASEAEQNGGDWADSEWHDDRFDVDESMTLESLRAEVLRVGELSAEIVRTVDLDLVHALPEAPWFEPGAAWTARRVALHVIAEISQHAGHADLLREAIDGQKTMG